MARSRMMNYEELLASHPDLSLWRTGDYFQENTPEATERGRLARLAEIGYVVKFIQDNGLTRRVLSTSAPDIPSEFCVYLRDITPEGLEFYRLGYLRWAKRFERDMNADPSDVRVMERALAEMRGKAKSGK